LEKLKLENEFLRWGTWRGIFTGGNEKTEEDEGVGSEQEQEQEQEQEA